MSKKRERTDPHRPGAIVPAEYHAVLSYALPANKMPGIGFNCEIDRRWHELDANDRVIATHEGKHATAENAVCCIAKLVERGLKFAETGGTGKCSVCGAWFKYGDVWLHEPTGEHIHIGHDCADKYELVMNRTAFELEVDRRKKAAQRELIRGKNKRARDAFLAKHPGLEEAFDHPHYIIQDIKARFTKWCDVSDNAIDLVFKIISESWMPARPPEIHVPAPEGRCTFEGVVVSTKAVDSDWGTAIKMTVKVTTPSGATWLAWGTAPNAILGDKLLRGATVRVTATLKRGRDAHFAMFKRPQAEVLAYAEAA